MNLHDPTLLTMIAGACLFLLMVATLRHYTTDSILPPESWLLLGGVLYGNVQYNYAPNLPSFELTPVIVIWLLLPLLIFGSSRHLSPKHLLEESVPITLFAVVGVIASLFLIGVPLSLAMNIPLIHGLLFASAVVATDPSAVAAIFKSFPIPERLAIILEGESMFNDGAAIVIFALMASIVLTGETFDPIAATGQFAWAILGAIPLGLALGWLTGKVVLRWHEQNQFSGLTLTVLLAYGSFLIGEGLLHVSGVITVLCAAIAFTRNRQRRNHPLKHELFHSFWGYIEIMAGSVLFFALGTALGSHTFPLSPILPGVVMILLASRAIVVYGGTALLNLRPGSAPIPAPWQHVLMLGGVRGAVSAALVLMIPADYQYRFEMLCLVFVLCFYTLVVHPPLLKWYLAKGAVKDA